MLTTRAHAADLRAQIERLAKQLEEERAERARLLDRLLERHNYAPLAEQPRAAVGPPVRIISPFGGGATPEMTEAMRESWVMEEAAYLEAEQGFAPAQAREMAEQRWLSEHR